MYVGILSIDMRFLYCQAAVGSDFLFGHLDGKSRYVFSKQFFFQRRRRREVFFFSRWIEALRLSLHSTMYFILYVADSLLA